MTETEERPANVRIPSDLDAASAVACHALLLSRLREAERTGAPCLIDLGEEAESPSVLALQLLVSAGRSFPGATLAFGPRADAALSLLAQAKEA